VKKKRKNKKMPREPGGARVYSHYALLLAQRDSGDAAAERELRRRVVTYSRVVRAIGYAPDASARLEVIGSVQLRGVIKALYSDRRIRRLYTSAEFLTTPLGELCGLGDDPMSVDSADSDSGDESSIDGQTQIGAFFF
jgi:hypothetical protein